MRPHLEFAAPAWSPWQRGDIDILENVQERMVREVSGLKSRTYEERLTELGMETLEKRSQDQDLVTAYKILNGVRQVPVPEERTHRRRTQHCQSYLKKNRTSAKFL